VLAWVSPLIVAASSGGCGRVAATTDGSPATPDGGTGRRSFDVLAVLTAADGGTGSGLPATNGFTLVLDPDASRAIAGGNGFGAVVGVTSTDGRTFRSTAPFAVGDDPSACTSVGNVMYQALEVTITGGSLAGTASGIAVVSCGDCSFNVPFSASLSGTADTTPPTLRASGPPPSNPFDLFNLVTSEPLPATAVARLVADDGAAIDLVPQIVDGTVPLIVGFSKPDVVLRAGQGYVVAFDGLVDFAGLTDPTGPPLRLSSFPAAPTVPEDGFESATSDTLGGALVMTGGPLPAIDGNTSIYIGGGGAPGLDLSTGRSLMVRLERQPGDTTLRFSYRVVAFQILPTFYGVLRVGSEGASTGPPVNGIVDQSSATEMLTVSGRTVFATVPAEMDVALPADATGTVLLVLGPNRSACSEPSTGEGLLIDDLRLE
jgi:hypothetical protein